jgi:hypothetical protein
MQVAVINISQLTDFESPQAEQPEERFPFVTGVV